MGRYSEFRTSVLPTAGLVCRSDGKRPDGLRDPVVEYDPHCPSSDLLYFGYPAHSKTQVRMCCAPISYDGRQRAMEPDMVID